MLTRLIILLLIISPNAFALSDSSNAVGRYWGDVKKHAHKKKPIKKQAQVVETISARAVLSEITASIDEAKAKAILEPTIENVASYRKIQNKTIHLSENFSDTWQNVSLKYPELDYQSSHSANAQALKIAESNKLQKIDKTLSFAARAYAIVYFYDRASKEEALQASILNQISKKYGFDLLGAPIGNKHLVNIKTNIQGGAQFKAMRARQAPAIFIFNPTNGKYEVVSYSILAQAELEERLMNIFLKADEVL